MAKRRCNKRVRKPEGMLPYRIQLGFNGNRDRAFTLINNKRFYLGEYGSAESYQIYSRIVAEYGTAGVVQGQQPADLTLLELVEHYVRWAKNHYGDATPVRHAKEAARIMLELYGDQPAEKFSPVKLIACRGRMIEKGWTRVYINQQISALKRIFKWATVTELVGPSVLHGLQAVDGLRRGQSNAREGKRIKPVPDKEIEAIRPYVMPVVWDVIQLQLLTAARPSELLNLKMTDLDRSGEIWKAELNNHKTANRGYNRTLYFGPQAQQILTRRMLGKSFNDYLFSPKDAIRERAAKYQSHRRPDQKPNPRKTEREVGNCYDKDSYLRAIHRACELAFPAPEPLCRHEGESIKAWKTRLTPEQKTKLKKWLAEHQWSPYRLRHNAATNIRKVYGIETARAILGHTSIAVTEIYAEMDRETAIKAILKLG